MLGIPWQEHTHNVIVLEEIDKPKNLIFQAYSEQQCFVHNAGEAMEGAEKAIMTAMIDDKRSRGRAQRKYFDKVRQLTT